MKKVFLFNLIIILSLFTGYAQDEDNPITTAASFLLIAPDARSGSMGDIGVATSPDANSQYFNPAKNIFSDSQYTAGLNYTPWLRNLTNDVFISYTSFLIG